MVVVFAAVYIRRFGARGRALGMVAFMSYFFTLYLRAGISELPWLIGAVVVGTVCTFVMSAYVLPDRPERVLRGTIRALRARMAIVVDTTAEAVRTGRLDERRRRRMRARTIRLNETALMVQSQIEDKADPAVLWPGVTSEQLAPWLFDAELAIEWVATAGRRAAAIMSETPTAIPAATRADLIGALTQLARAIRIPQAGGLPQAASQAQRILDRQSAATAADEADEAGEIAVRRLALAIINAATATAEVRAMVEGAAAGKARALQGADSVPPPASDAAGADDATERRSAADHPAGHPGVHGRVVGHRDRRVGFPLPLVLGGNRGVRDLRRHQLLGRNPDQGLAAAARHHARRALRRAGCHAVRRRQDRLAGRHLRVPVLRVLLHDGHLQPDDLLDHDDAGVAVRLDWASSPSAC